MGVPIKSTGFLFGENKTAVDSNVKPASKLNEQHILLSYHRVREAIVAQILHFILIPGLIDASYVLSKDTALNE